MRCHEELPIAEPEPKPEASEDDAEVDGKVAVAALQPNSDGFMFLRVCVSVDSLTDYHSTEQPRVHSTVQLDVPTTS